MPCYSPLKGWKDEVSGGFTTSRRAGAQEMEVACGQCIGCRLDRSRMWAMRITHEASLRSSIGNAFVTLTYRSELEASELELDRGLHLPKDWSLNKKHFQKFMKRLRKEFPQRIKYYHCGEYGSICEHGFDLEEQECPLCNVGRPHYHACLFNVSFDDLTPYATKGDKTYFTSPKLERIWKYGFVDVGELNFQTAAYVARYILKKITGPRAEGHYEKITLDGEVLELEPEYATMSNGIGKEWYQRYKADVFPSDEVPVPGHGVIKGVPRYYEELLRLEDEWQHEEVKQNRQIFRAENAHEYTPERLMAKYKVKKAQLSTLKRGN